MAVQPTDTGISAKGQKANQAIKRLLVFLSDQTGSEGA
jgi:hypothetical protein